MGFTKIFDGAYLIPMGFANAVLLDADGDLVLVDACFPNKEGVVFDALDRIGRRSADLKHVVFTHGHPDHIGSAAAIVRATGATTYMQAADAPPVESGGPFRPMTPGPGPIRKIALRFVYKPDERLEPLRIDRHIGDGETLPLAGGLKVIHAPGHSAGQVALLWQRKPLLIAGDVFINILGPADPIGFEDASEGRRSQRKLAELDFEAACFGHGKAIVSGARRQIRQMVDKR